MNPAALPTHPSPLTRRDREATMLGAVLCLPIAIPLGLQLSFAHRAHTTPVFTIPDVTDLAKRLFPDFPR